jgi:hypothetical protein
MTDYKQAKNPYLSLYTSSILKLVQSTGKEAAELISTQITLMHNALGYVINDLMRMLAQQFSNPANNLIQKNSSQDSVSFKI